MSDRPLEFIFGSADSNPLDVTWGPYMFAGLDYRPARKRVDLITAEDSDGGVPLGVAKSDNMVMALRLRIDEGASMDAALEQMHRLQKKLDDAAKRGPDGLECVWRPEGASERSTFFLLEGEIAEAPQEMSGADIGWYHKSPIVVVTMICKPFFYGDLVTETVATGSLPYLSQDIANVAGDVDAEGLMIVSDTATQDHSSFEWGLEHLHYDPTDPAPVLLQDGSGLTVPGEGASGTDGYNSSSISNPESGVGQPTVWAIIDPQPYAGPRRVKVRVRNGSGWQYSVRLAYRVGDGPLIYLDWVTAPIMQTSGSGPSWLELDLGVTNVAPADTGATAWSGLVQIRSKSTSQIMSLNYMEVLPAERYGKVTNSDAFPSDFAVYAHDDFALASGGLQTDTLTSGQTWGTGGDGDDFQAGTVISTALGDSVTRAAVSDTLSVGRYAVTGPLLVNQRSRIGVHMTVASVISSGRIGAVARDSSGEFLLACVVPLTVAGGVVTEWTLAAYHLISGTMQLLAVNRDQVVSSEYIFVSIEVCADGRYRARLWDALGLDANVCELVGWSEDCETGGTLATGQAGFYDEWSSATACTRRFFGAELASSDSSPTPVLHSGRTLEVAHDRCERYDASGVYVATPERVLGSRFFIPPSGDTGRTTRLVTRVRRPNTAIAFAENVTDAQSVQVKYRPRYRNPIGTS